MTRFATVGALAITVVMLSSTAFAQSESADHWIKGCMDQFEGVNQAKTNSLWALGNQPPPTHYENRQFCIQEWNSWNPPSRQLAEDPGYKGKRLNPRRVQE